MEQRQSTTSRSFAEHGYAAAPLLCPAGELRVFREHFCSPAGARRTVVYAIERDVVRGCETYGNARAVVEVIQEGECELEFAQWYCKPTSSSEAVIPWHQDRAFWSADRAYTLTTWIALDDVSERNGCVVVRPGSHVEPEIRDHVADPATGVLSCSVEGFDDSVPMEMSAGMGFVYHERLIHRSGGNQTTDPRRALVLGWACCS